MLIGMAALITLMAIIYARVDWYGKKVWEEDKREMAANGEVWDWSAFAPAPVAAEQNIFEAPKMTEWFGDERTIATGPLDKPITNSFAQRFLNPDSTAEIKTEMAAARYVAWSDQFQDDFDTIGMALKRPYARIVADYSRPLAITLPNVSTLSAVVNTLVQRAKCHLILGQSDKAWQELMLLRNLRRMVERQDKFITTEGAWMSREITRHSLQIISTGTELHAWQESQLAALQGELKNDDVIALQADALRCGRAILLCSAENGEIINAQFRTAGDRFWTRVRKRSVSLIIGIAPRGSMYAHAAGLSKSFRIWINALTPADGIIHPGDVSKAFGNWKRAQQGLPLLLQTQTLINEGEIACALERYRLVHGEYPEAPQILVPHFIEKLPRDIINGEPFIYRRTQEGSFLLYSVGWDEKDDGGKIVSTKGQLKHQTFGDWVWKGSLKQE